MKVFTLNRRSNILQERQENIEAIILFYFFFSIIEDKVGSSLQTHKQGAVPSKSSGNYE